ncbi:hypothetical protein Acor_81780 [Acrocarpospora corrugata]|uniref:Uncharacterized protein n=1 Tax=Acrocarpospora corrugata TaxID=35763 RepID=A0A5M3WCN6_9ACTN|nr:hypothetical protein [Acrocarpospora corrugata]GES06109.1 hypothetical protein Acor_81780 [Acrocarpospora corrugata]
MADDAYYSWQEAAFTVNILLAGGVDPENLETGDSIVTLPGGEKYSALMMTREEISRVMDRQQSSAESLGGSYFCTPDLVVVRSRGVAAMIDIVRDLVESEEISRLLPRISNDGILEIPSN